jgi:hypothetical protein
VLACSYVFKGQKRFLQVGKLTVPKSSPFLQCSIYLKIDTCYSTLYRLMCQLIIYNVSGYKFM